MNGVPVLTILTFVPLLGGAAVIALGQKGPELARRLALGCGVLVLAMAVGIAAAFDHTRGDLQFVEHYNWIPTLGVSYHLGVDGLGMLMVLLSAVVTPMSILASQKVTERAWLYFGLVLFLEAGLIGTFTAMNFFHWFLFWELSLVPAFFLIRLWGGYERVRAANLFFVYTMVGSVALLLGFLAVFLATRQFGFLELAEMARDGRLAAQFSSNVAGARASSGSILLLAFFGVFLGFAVKVPITPFHTWLPLTYSEAPVGVTMLLTGAMSKMGVYGLLRILWPIFPEQMKAFQTPLLWLAVISIVFSASVALAQRDLRRLLAYSSINHLGYCLLGTFALAGGSAALQPALERTAALNGVFLQMFNHGLTASVLFWMVGLLEQRSGGFRGLNDFGGLRSTIPVFCGFMGIALFSSLGLPGLNGFVSEFLIFKGVFPLASMAAVLSLPGLLLTAIFLLVLLERVFYGPRNERWLTMPDLSVRERLVLFPPLALMFVLGLYPQVVIGLVNRTAMSLAQVVKF